MIELFLGVILLSTYFTYLSYWIHNSVMVFTGLSF